MPPLVAALIAGGIAAGGSVAASAATDAGSGNTAAIKRLKAAQARGELTPAGQALAQQGYAEAKRAQAEIQDAAARQMARQGATSGADIEAMQTAANKGASDLYTRLGDRVRAEQAAEGQELEDRMYLRRQRRQAAAASAIKAGAAAGGAAARGAAYKQGKEKEGLPEWEKIADPEDRAAVQQFYDAAKKAGKDDKWIEDAMKAYYTSGME